MVRMRRDAAARLTAVLLVGGVALVMMVLRLSSLGAGELPSGAAAVVRGGDRALGRRVMTGPVFRVGAQGTYFSFKPIPKLRTTVAAAAGGAEKDTEGEGRRRHRRRSRSSSSSSSSRDESDDAESGDGVSDDSEEGGRRHRSKRAAAAEKKKVAAKREADDDDDDSDDSDDESGSDAGDKMRPTTGREGKGAAEDEGEGPPLKDLPFRELLDYLVDQKTGAAAASSASGEDSDEEGGGGGEDGAGDHSDLVWKKPPSSLRHLERAAIVVLTYNRPELLARCLDALQRADLAGKMKVYVSVDGDEDGETAALVEERREEWKNLVHLVHPRQPIAPISKDVHGRVVPTKAPGTMYLARHYKWALSEVLLKREHTHAIVVEDDMLVSKDFISLFEQTAPLLAKDKTLMCVSSWNDNGYGHLRLPEKELFRTGFFPGLGWMLTKKTWQELEPGFPRDQWDHWMRAQTTARGRECVVPFLSRNRNVGAKGSTSNKDFFARYLKDVAHYDGTSSVALGDLRYLLSSRYKTRLHRLVEGADATLSASEITLPDESEADPSWMSGKEAATFLVPYSRESYDQLSKRLRIYATPRAFHQYTTVLKYREATLLLLDRRMSPYLPESKALRPAAGLRAVGASGVGQSCNDVCEAQEGGWDCARSQFDWVNQCRVLAKVFDGCPHGCRREWGKDIPNLEHLGATENAFGGQQCLVTEDTPTCDARHAKTQRVCPCVPRGGAATARASSLRVEAAKRPDMSCIEVCATLHGGYRCDEGQFHYANSCKALKKHFPCKSCAVNQGGDIPNYVSEPSGMRRRVPPFPPPPSSSILPSSSHTTTSASDKNHGVCLTQKAAPTCAGRHRNTQRVCDPSPQDARAASNTHIHTQTHTHTHTALSLHEGLVSNPLQKKYRTPTYTNKKTPPSNAVRLNSNCPSPHSPSSAHHSTPPPSFFPFLYTNILFDLKKIELSKYDKAIYTHVPPPHTCTHSFPPLLFSRVLRECPSPPVASFHPPTLVQTHTHTTRINTQH